MHSHGHLGCQGKRAFALLVGLLISGTLLYAADPCMHPPFQGFDSRLQIRYLGRVPITKDLIVGFEILSGRPVVAYSHSVIAVEHHQAMRYNTTDRIVGISADALGGLWLQTAARADESSRSLSLLQKTGFVPDQKLAVSENSIFHDSGNPVFLEVVQEMGSAKLFAVRQQDNVKAYIAPVHGSLHALSWNQIGLAAVVDAGVYAWQAGNNDLARVAVDTGFSKAQDVALVAPDRVAVAMQNYVVLLGRSGQTVIVGIKARCRFIDATLYLLDERGGFLWAVRGIEKLGDRNADKDYARQLIQSNPGNATESSSRYLEAVRLIGCTQTAALRAVVLKNGGALTTIRDVRAGLPEPVHEFGEPGITPPRRISPPPAIPSTVTSIKLGLVIGADGAVRSGEVLAAPAPQLGNEALERARQWRYDPAIKNGRPVAIRLVENVPLQNQATIVPTASQAQRYFDEGQGLIRKGKFPEALTFFDKALAADPRFAEAYYQKGLALIASSTVGPDGKTVVRPGAVEALRRYLELSPQGEHAQAANDMLESISR